MKLSIKILNIYISNKFIKYITLYHIFIGYNETEHEIYIYTFHAQFQKLFFNKKRLKYKL